MTQVTICPNRATRTVCTAPDCGCFPPPTCETCKHSMEDTFAPLWCVPNGGIASEIRAEGDCGKAGDMWEPKI